MPTTAAMMPATRRIQQRQMQGTCVLVTYMIKCESALVCVFMYTCMHECSWVHGHNLSLQEKMELCVRVHVRVRVRSCVSSFTRVCRCEINRYCHRQSHTYLIPVRDLQKPQPPLPLPPLSEPCSDWSILCTCRRCRLGTAPPRRWGLPAAVCVYTSRDVLECAPSFSFNDECASSFSFNDSERFSVWTFWTKRSAERYTIWRQFGMCFVLYALQFFHALQLWSYSVRELQEAVTAAYYSQRNFAAKVSPHTDHMKILAERPSYCWPAAGDRVCRAWQGRCAWTPPGWPAPAPVAGSANHKRFFALVLVQCCKGYLR